MLINQICLPLTTVFIAGVMQGRRDGQEIADQSYRDSIRSAIIGRFPQARIHDPAIQMWSDLRNSRQQIREAHAALSSVTSIDCNLLDDPVAELREIFHKQTALAGTCELCVAFLPNSEPSMGTAAEMLTAYNAGKYVVSITNMKQNLAILSCSNLIIEDLASFEVWLETQSEAYRGSRN